MQLVQTAKQIVSHVLQDHTVEKKVFPTLVVPAKLDSTVLKDPLFLMTMTTFVRQDTAAQKEALLRLNVKEAHTRMKMVKQIARLVLRGFTAHLMQAILLLTIHHTTAPQAITVLLVLAVLPNMAAHQERTVP